MPTKAVLTATAALALVILHFIRREDPAPLPPPKPWQRSVVAEPMDVRVARDHDARTRFHEGLRSSVLDSGESREAKDYRRTISLLGTSPIETIGDGPGQSTITVMAGTGDVIELLRSGGSYSGPLPDDVARVVHGGD